MELDEAMRLRRSVRCYDAATKVSREEIEKIIRAAQEAPSWKNLQTGRYHVVTTPEEIDALRPLLGEKNRRLTQGIGALVVTTFVKDKAGFSPEGMAVNDLGNAWGAYDLGLQAMLLLLQAAQNGFDTIVMGMRDARAIRQLLGIPAEETVVSVIGVGNRPEGFEAPRPARLPLDQILTWH